MDSYMDALRAYLAENKSSHRCVCANSILNMLFCCYSQQRLGDPIEIRTKLQMLDQILDKLSEQEKDQITDLVCELYTDSQADAFREGISVGFQLFDEITKKRTDN